MWFLFHFPEKYIFKFCSWSSLISLLGTAASVLGGGALVSRAMCNSPFCRWWSMILVMIQIQTTIAIQIKIPLLNFLDFGHLKKIDTHTKKTQMVILIIRARSGQCCLLTMTAWRKEDHVAPDPAREEGDKHALDPVREGQYVPDPVLHKEHYCVMLESANLLQITLSQRRTLQWVYISGEGKYATEPGRMSSR